MSEIIEFILLMQVLGLLALLIYFLSDYLEIDSIRKKLIFIIGILSLILVPWVLVFYYIN